MTITMLLRNTLESGRRLLASQAGAHAVQVTQHSAPGYV
jgi:hypothetical protein